MRHKHSLVPAQLGSICLRMPCTWMFWVPRTSYRHPAKKGLVARRLASLIYVCNHLKLLEREKIAFSCLRPFAIAKPTLPKRPPLLPVSEQSLGPSVVAWPLCSPSSKALQPLLLIARLERARKGQTSSYISWLRTILYWNKP